MRPLSEALAAVPVLAIVRHRDSAGTAATLEELARGGVRAVEVTTSTPGWPDLVAGAPAGLAIGVGTVTSLAHVRDARAAGATFVVSPGLDAEVVRAALDAGLDPLPGVLTGTEIAAARRAGAATLKLFPAEPLGPAYLRSLRAPFDDVAFVPTGGIAIAGVPGWLAAGAAAVALGGDLTGSEGPRDDDGRRQQERRAAEAVRLAVAARAETVR